MGLGFHKGLTAELRLKLQPAGLRIEEVDAQRALAGYPLVRSNAQVWVSQFSEEILVPPTNTDLMLSWENDHPGEKPFPPNFAEVVLRELMGIDPENPGPTINKLMELAQKEIAFG